ncbi:MAG: hypothetical protein N2491_05160 [Negativicutes bacterium]|nr:hypothetical protein [Negativicutes bacterium]
MRRKIILLSMTIVLLLLAGCDGAKRDLAGLTAVAGEANARWGLPNSVRVEGQGNIVRIVTGPGLGAPEALEMAAGGMGKTVYTKEIPAGPDAAAAYRLQFLSTRGTGRVVVSVLDEQGTAIGAVGWVFTGHLPLSEPAAQWIDVRYQANYAGDWVSQKLNLQDVVARHLPAALGKAHRYRLAVEAGEGQHALITEMTLFHDLTRLVKLTPVTDRFAVQVGDVLTVRALLENQSNRVIPNIRVEAVEPYGSGITCAENRFKDIAALRPGEKRPVEWKVRAHRPDAVNRGKPWKLVFKADGREMQGDVTVSVADNRPGRIFYVMTDDLEPIDAAGYPVAWGNANGWLEPEEYRVQMVQKAEVLNGIAEKYGAKWTHYIAWPAVRAAEWAATRSGSGKWPAVVEAIKNSVRRQSARGHEYALHLHSDYDPYLPGNVLSYNAEVDGIWANHLRHGWAHSIAAEGSFDNFASRTGFLFYYQRILDDLSAGSPLGQLITARVGSFDFGQGSESEAISTRAYRKVGLWASSDADGNSGGVTSAPYGQEIYLAKPDDINAPAVDIRHTGLVEFRPTPRVFLQYDSQSAAVMNRKVDEGIAFFTENGKVKPGVHGIIGFTHTMFVMGQGGWQSYENGQFSAIDSHLGYLKERYAERGLISFGVANDLVKAYLDYYTPLPLAVYGARKSATPFASEYEIVLLGRDIPLDADRPWQVTVKYPLYLRDSAYRISILKNGEPVFSTFGLPTPYNDIAFVVDDKTAAYTMKIYHQRGLFKLIELWRGIKHRIF